MRKTILTCDRCKKEVNKLCDVGAGLMIQSCGAYGNTGNIMAVRQLTAEWCFDCCVEMHLTKPSIASTVAPGATPPTIEDMIREIIREEFKND